MITINDKMLELNPEIKQGNIDIALLDGWKENEFGGYSKGTRLLLAEEFKYHLNWQWLMPFITKIENLGYEVSIEGETCKIENTGILVTPQEGMETATEMDKDDAKRASVWVAASKFAKWYKEQLSNEPSLD